MTRNKVNFIDCKHKTENIHHGSSSKRVLEKTEFGLVVNYSEKHSRQGAFAPDWMLLRSRGGVWSSNGAPWWSSTHISQERGMCGYFCGFNSVLVFILGSNMIVEQSFLSWSISSSVGVQSLTPQPNSQQQASSERLLGWPPRPRAALFSHRPLSPEKHTCTLLPRFPKSLCRDLMIEKYLSWGPGI